MTIKELDNRDTYAVGLFEPETSNGESTVISSGEVLTEETPISQKLTYETPYGDFLVEILGSAPPKFINMIDEIIELLWLPQNWNSYGSNRVNPDIAKCAIEFLPSILGKQTPIPLVGPTSQGGIQIEWHENGIDLEIEFISPDTISVLHVADENYIEWEQGANDSLDRLNAIIIEISTGHNG